MSHTSEKRWSDTSAKASGFANEIVTILNNAEEAYQQMQEMYVYAGSTAADLAELLFLEDIAVRPSPDNVASTEEIAKAQDLIDAMTAAHQLWQAANNTAITVADRMTDLRRMI